MWIQRVHVAKTRLAAKPGQKQIIAKTMPTVLINTRQYANFLLTTNMIRIFIPGTNKNITVDGKIFVVKLGLR